MENKYVFYCVDTEGTGLNSELHDVIEVSICRMSDNVIKTWKIKPTNFETIDDGALRVNGHKKEDITWQTKFGRENYLEANKAIIDIENFILEDGVSAETRCIIGQNAAYDIAMLQGLWKKCNSSDSFPFGRRYLDTMVAQLMFDYIYNSFAEGYSLANLTKRYNVKNNKAHTAEADTLATKEVFLAQVEDMRKKLGIK